MQPNFIAGNWVEADEAIVDVNPSDLNDVVGEYAAASRTQADEAIAAAAAAGPAGRPRPPASEPSPSRRSASSSRRAPSSSASCSRGRRASRARRASARSLRAVADLQVLRRRGAARQAASICAVVRPGVDVEITPRAARRRRAHHAVELPDRDPRLEDRAGARLRQLRRVQARRRSSRLGVGARRDRAAAPGCRRARFNLVMGSRRRRRRTSPGRPARARRLSFTGSQAVGTAWRRRSPRGSAKYQLEMGGKNPLVVLDDADLERRRRLRGPGRVLPDRPALHGEQPVDRRPPGSTTRSSRRMVERMRSLRVGRRARRRHRDRTGRRARPARAGRGLPGVGKDGGRAHGLRRRTPGARHAGPLPRAGALHRHDERHAGQPRGDLRPGRDRDPRRGLRRRRSRSPTTPSSACRPASAPPRSSTRSTSSATPRPGMVMVNLPTAGVDFHVPFGGRKGSRATARASRAATPSSSTPPSRPPTCGPDCRWGAYVALLRGINVGGRNVIRMADLKACFERQGVRTGDHLHPERQRGVHVFGADRAATDGPDRRDARGAFGYDASVILRTGRQLRAIVEGAPEGFGADPSRYRYDVIFLKAPLTARTLRRICPRRRVWTGSTKGTASCTARVSSARRPRAGSARITALPIYPSVTIRNWNTTTRLLQMVGR